MYAKVGLVVVDHIFAHHNYFFDHIFLFLSLLIPSFSLQGMSKMADLSDITDYGLKDEEQLAQHLSKEEYDKQSQQLKRLQTM